MLPVMFEHLFTPAQLGTKTAKNRIYMSPITALFAGIDGHASDQYVAFIEERARQGVGTISTGMHLVLPNAVDFPGALTVYDDGCLPGLKRLASAIHNHGALAIAELNHTGRQTDSSISRTVLYAPSPLACEVIGEVPKEMEPEDIAEVVEAFRRAAGYAAEAGYDGLEIHCATGYLLEQYLSPFSNKRQDDYGGSLENRRRLLSEVIDAARAGWGGRPPILGVKLTVRQRIPGGLTLEDGCAVAEWLDREKQVDFIHVSEGPYEAGSLEGYGMHLPLGANVKEAAAVKSRLHGALTVANRRIKYPAQAEQILAEGKADLISMARALIADAGWAAKAAAGRGDEVRQCTGCVQECIGRMFRLLPISCLVNPAVGREAQWADHLIVRAPRPRRVVVIGGGPAGMKAAEIAARRGHQVALYEAASRLGGQVNLASIPPYRQELGEVVSHLSGELERLGVDVHLRSRLSAADVLGLEADAVVVATGSTTVPPQLLMFDGAPPLVSVREVLAGAKIAGPVLLLDFDGHWPGLVTAEHLATGGAAVTLVTPMPAIGLQVFPKSEVNVALRRMYKLGAEFVSGYGVAGIEGGDAVLIHSLSGAERRLTGFQTIVYVGGEQADNALYQALKGRVPALYAAGDCVAPRRATDAIFEGHQVGMSI